MIIQNMELCLIHCANVLQCFYVERFIEDDSYTNAMVTILLLYPLPNIYMELQSVNFKSKFCFTMVGLHHVLIWQSRMQHDGSLFSHVDSDPRQVVDIISVECICLISKAVS